jgi:hypothetical protein
MNDVIFLKDLNLNLFMDKSHFVFENLDEQCVKETISFDDIFYNPWNHHDEFIMIKENGFIKLKKTNIDEVISNYRMGCIFSSMFGCGYYPKTFYVIGIGKEFDFNEFKFNEYFKENRVELISFYPLFEVESID